MDEFEVIKNYFSRGSISDDVRTGIGDDCAIVSPPSGRDLVMSIDTMVEGVHFPKGAKAKGIGSRAMATALSDLAAMGARPHWFTLALTMPETDEHWLSDFSDGLFSVANTHECCLIGGDTTRGPLTITVQVHGSVETGKAIRRAGAQPDDMIFVTGCLGDGGAVLKLMSCDITVRPDAQEYLYERFYNPRPRIQEGEMLSGVASAAIDISDGLLTDLEKLCRASGVGAVIDTDRLPISKLWRESTEDDKALHWALSAGDDYELCFTVPKKHFGVVEQWIKDGRLKATPIGKITNNLDVSVVRHARAYNVESKGYMHFA